MQDVLGKYNSNMSIVKQRILHCDNMLSKHTFSVIDMETIALQFRKIFEMSAYTSLLALGLTQEVSKRWKNEYPANKVLKYVKSKNDQCLPHPIAIERNSSSGAWDAKDIEVEFDYCDFVSEVYPKCDPLLHDLHLEETIKEMQEIRVFFKDLLHTTYLFVWQHRIHIDNHLIILACGEKDASPPRTITASGI